MRHAPLISTIIPVYNCELYLAEALKSVLAQTYGPVEIIVVDDGSTDGSAKVAQDFSASVGYFRQPNSGAGAARNCGVALSKGEFLAFLDADDIWAVEKLSLQMAVFQDNPGVDFVFGHVKQFFSPELDEGTKSKLHCPDGELPGYYPGSMLVKRESFFRVGLFETDWGIGEFINWYIKSKEIGLVSLLIPEVVAKRRLHANNMSARKRDSQTDYVRILKASLDRRRASARTRQGPVSE
jgi:glycosyltransferase involved in cell wall biosynthesis